MVAVNALFTVATAVLTFAKTIATVVGGFLPTAPY